MTQQMAQTDHRFRRVLSFYAEMSTTELDNAEKLGSKFVELGALVRSERREADEKVSKRAGHMN